MPPNAAADTNRAIHARREEQALLDPPVAVWKALRVVKTQNGYTVQHYGSYRVGRTHAVLASGKFSGGTELPDFLDVCKDATLAGGLRDEQLAESARIFAQSRGGLSGNDLRTLNGSLLLVTAANHGVATFDLMRADAYLTPLSRAS